MTPAILAIDQGTTRTKAMVFDATGTPIAEATVEVPLTFPTPGWVEADPEALLGSVVDTGRQALATTGAEVVAMGLANQGETVVAWDRRTGEPVYPAIGWQDRRTEDRCERLRDTEAGALITARTGLPLDPYFSATKIAWILDQVAGARALAARGHLLAGTTDAWLLWRLTGRHATDHSTASRTMLYNLSGHDWDDDVLAALDIPRAILPVIRPTVASFGTVDAAVMGRALPVRAAIVDQQGALFGQACFHPGDVKVTYGTGAFVLMNTGPEVPVSHHGLLTTVAWALEPGRGRSADPSGGGRPDGLDYRYALDGGIYVAGAVAQWLRDGLGIVRDVVETADLAASAPDNGGVYFVPALAGLAAPYWDSHARGTILGITRGTTRAHIVRAALEGVAFRSRDVLDAMARDTGKSIGTLRADGGMSANGFLMQMLADIVQARVEVAAVRETTALGTAFLAGLGSGLWTDLDQIARLWRAGHTYSPSGGMNLHEQYRWWQRAVERARGWAAPL